MNTPMKHESEVPLRNPSPKARLAEELLIANDIQFHSPTTGHYVIEGLADSKSKITFFPRSCKLQISKKGIKTEYIEFSSMESAISYILSAVEGNYVQ